MVCKNVRTQQMLAMQGGPVRGGPVRTTIWRHAHHEVRPGHPPQPRGAQVWGPLRRRSGGASCCRPGPWCFLLLYHSAGVTPMLCLSGGDSCSRTLRKCSLQHRLLLSGQQHRQQAPSRVRKRRLLRLRVRVRQQSPTALPSRASHSSQMGRPLHRHRRVNARNARQLIA